MAGEAGTRHPVILILDVLVFAFAIAELIEALFDVGLHLILEESALQVVMLILRTAALWHAGRHVRGKA
ncbi:MAG TPA: hypothetical protein VL993_04385 [Stellaceae bacterium]|nr:hypothetical protein [Stellaceae bacterium]